MSGKNTLEGLNEDAWTEEAHAYTPGLKVKRHAVIEKIKRLPLPGEVLVSKGERVDFDTIIARTKTPGTPHLVNVAASLNVEAHDISEFMVKKEGDSVAKGEIIAELRLLLGLIKNTAKSPMDGYIEKVSCETGRVTVREPDQLLELRSSLSGTVVEVIPNEGAVIRTSGSYIQGILGIGGEVNGELVMGVKSTREVLDAGQIIPQHGGKIVVLGALATRDALKAAVKCDVAGVIAGGINYMDLAEFMGQPLGVAITGEEKLGLTLVITEGFGRMNMSLGTFEILESLRGRRVAMDGTTQIRAGVIRPEIIGPKEGVAEERSDRLLDAGMRPGTKVRIIQSPQFGEFGRVVRLPAALKEIETESLVRVVEIELEKGERVVIPRANVEIIEE